MRIVGVSDKPLFLGEYSLQDQEPSIIISAFDLTDLNACNHMLYRNLIIGHFLILESNNSNQLGSRFSFEGECLQTTLGMTVDSKQSKLKMKQTQFRSC